MILTSRKASSIPEFCYENGISRSHYYVLKALGLGPHEMRLGRRVLVTTDAAEEWRRAREAETTPPSAVGAAA
jgi:hypothetical protein